MHAYGGGTARRDEPFRAFVSMHVDAGRGVVGAALQFVVMQTLQLPSLDESNVQRVVAGLRPCRRGGLRLEREDVSLSGRSKTVVHNYGHGGCGITIGFGTASVAVDRVCEVLGVEAHDAQDIAQRDAERHRTVSIAVLGAGVAGLTTARELLRRGFAVTVYASRFANDTTSGVAGALWLPTDVEFGQTAAEVARMREILHRARRAFASLDRHAWGVERLPVYETDNSPYCEKFFNNGTIDPPTPLDRLPLPGEAPRGHVFETDYIHTPRFLRALRADVERSGARFVERTFDSIDEIVALGEPVVVNCLGLGARELFDDDAVYPARGVLVHMRPQRLGYILQSAPYRYIFPREDALILGGCFDENVWDDQPDERIAREILEYHQHFFEQL